MLAEDAVPVGDRYLRVGGLAAPDTYVAVKQGLPQAGDGTEVCCLIDYAYADIPLGKAYERVCSRREPRCASRTPCIVRAVTQQFARPFDCIPHGWKTICVLAFPLGMPALIAQLPTVSSWGESSPDRHVLLCSDETWLTLEPGR